jgi:hypothetical protein
MNGSAFGELFGEQKPKEVKTNPISKQAPAPVVQQPIVEQKAPEVLQEKPKFPEWVDPSKQIPQEKEKTQVENVTQAATGESVKGQDFSEVKEEPIIREEIQPKEVNHIDREARKKIIQLFAFLVLTVLICITAIFFYLKASESNNGSENEQQEIYVKPNEIVVENALDSFVYKMVNGTYKINDSGAFAYIYDTVENGAPVKKSGTISLGEGVSDIEDYTFFLNGKIKSFDYNDDIRVFWDEDNVKLIASRERQEYFIVNDNSELNYKNYIGQHILQDLINDYLKNKAFIKQIDESTWEWEWAFYSPQDYKTKHKMLAHISVNPETEYVEEIILIYEDEEICIYSFAFEEIEPSVIPTLANEYKEVDEAEFIVLD